MQADDLRVTLTGLGPNDRVCIAAANSQGGILSTGSNELAAELSTILLRRLLLGRSARSWITSGMVSGPKHQ